MIIISSSNNQITGLYCKTTICFCDLTLLDRIQKQKYDAEVPKNKGLFELIGKVRPDRRTVTSKKE